MHSTIHFSGRLTSPLLVHKAGQPQVQTQRDTFTRSQPQFGHSDPPSEETLLQQQFQKLLHPETRSQAIGGLLKIIHAQNIPSQKLAVLLQILDATHIKAIPPEDLQRLYRLLDQLESPSKPKDLIPPSQKPEDKAFVQAAKAGDMSAIQQALAKGINIDIPVQEEKDDPIWTALHAAADAGHLEVVQALIAAGADANYRSYPEGTPLALAVKMGHLDIAKALIEAGTDVNAQDSAGKTALMHALLYTQNHADHLPLLTLLLESGAQVNVMDHEARTIWDQYQDFSKLYSLYNEPGQEDKSGLAEQVEKLLLTAGAVSADKIPEYQQALAFIKAVDTGDADQLEAFLEAGMDPNLKIPVQDPTRPLLTQAVMKGHWDVIHLLIEKGADINAPDRHGETALQMAVSIARWENKFTHREIVRLLIEMGADIHVKDTLGKNLLELTEEAEPSKGRSALIQTLKAAGVDH